MGKLSIEKRTLLGAFALAALIVPIVFGAVAQGVNEPVPLVRIEPDYPAAVLAGRSEGQVRLEFTITATGAVRDIRVVESSASELDAPTIAAVQKWRYQPIVENGAAVEKRGVRTLIGYVVEGGRTRYTYSVNPTLPR